MVFVGNTQHTVPYMLKNSDLFEELPDKYHDSAFIDRIHAYLPGWEVEVIRGEMFSAGYGFVVDYLAEILRYMRNEDFSSRFKDHFTLSTDISTRDRDGVNKTFSGLMKILFPGGGATEDETAEMLTLALEGRKRVKDQLKRIDSTYPDTNFSYIRNDGVEFSVTTLEEREFPEFYASRRKSDEGERSPLDPLSDTQPAISHSPTKANAVGPLPGHQVFAENQKGLNFEKLFWPWLEGATRIVVTDPYIHLFDQARNFMELVEMLAARKPADQELFLHLITAPDDINHEKQEANLQAIERAAAIAGITFSWEYDRSRSIHARHIVTDTGWKIGLDRGLDIFQRYEINDAFSLANKLQNYRSLKAFEITYMRDNTH
jgi:ATP-dependent Lon protease